MFTSNTATCLICRLNIGQSILKSFKTLRTLTVRMSGQTSLPNELMRHSGHWSSGIGHTINPLGIGHTGNRSDHEHSVPLSRSIRSDALEQGSNRTGLHSDVSRSSRRDSNTISLRHADPGEVSPASMIRHRHARSRSRSYDSVSPRRHSRSPSRSRGKKKKSRKKRKHSSTSSSSSRRSSSSSSRERERKRHKSKRNTLNYIRQKVTRVGRSIRGRGVLLHLRLLQFLQTLLLFFREAQPGRSLELIRGLLLLLMTILIPLLGLRVRRHTGIISVLLRIMMTNLIRSLRIIRTKRLILKTNMFLGHGISESC